jgi:hypothetical protein
VVLENAGFGIAECLCDVLAFGLLFESDTSEAAVDAMIFVEPDISLGFHVREQILLTKKFSANLPTRILIDRLQLTP